MPYANMRERKYTNCVLDDFEELQLLVNAYLLKHMIHLHQFFNTYINSSILCKMQFYNL